MVWGLRTDSALWGWYSAVFLLWMVIFLLCARLAICAVLFVCAPAEVSEAMATHDLIATLTERFLPSFCRPLPPASFSLLPLLPLGMGSKQSTLRRLKPLVALALFRSCRGVPLPDFPFLGFCRLTDYNFVPPNFLSVFGVWFMFAAEQ